MSRAKDGIDRFKHLHLSKYNIHDPDLPPPPPGYVLVIDQTAGDASLTASGATQATFDDMLAAAAEAHPRAHDPDQDPSRNPPPACAPAITARATRPDRITLITDPHSPWHLLDGAIAVYTVSRRKWGSRRSLPATSPMSGASPSTPAGA